NAQQSCDGSRVSFKALLYRKGSQTRPVLPVEEADLLLPFNAGMKKSGCQRLYGIDDIAPVQIAPLQTVDQHFGSGDVGGHRDVVHVTETEKVHVIGLVGLGAARVTEKQQQIDLIAGNAGCNLLVAALRTAQKTLNLQTGGF